MRESADAGGRARGLPDRGAHGGGPRRGPADGRARREHDRGHRRRHHRGRGDLAVRDRLLASRCASRATTWTRRSSSTCARATTCSIGERRAEEIKIALGSAYPKADERGTMEVKGRDLIDGLPKTVVVTGDEIREALREPVMAIVEAVRDLPRADARPSSPPTSWTRASSLTGGGALLRGLDRLLTSETGLPDPRERRPAHLRGARGRDGARRRQAARSRRLFFLAGLPRRASAGERHLRHDQPEVRARAEGHAPGRPVDDDLLEELEPGLLVVDDLGRLGVELPCASSGRACSAPAPSARGSAGRAGCRPSTSRRARSDGGCARGCRRRRAGSTAG